MRTLKKFMLFAAMIPLVTAFAWSTLGCNKKPAEVSISVLAADESFLKKYKMYESFIEHDEHAHRIAFIPNVPVKDFSWLRIGFDHDDHDTVVYEIAEVLYRVKELLPQKPLVVSWAEVGIMSAFGFSYRDANGQKKYFCGRTGNYGADPEEYDGPGFVITEIFPQKTLTGRYQFSDAEAVCALDLAETSYALQVNDVTYTGPAAIDFGDIGTGKDSWNVTLEGIRWAHNWIESFANGNPDSIDPDTMTDKETYGVFLWLEDGNTLAFQNRGNPMAPYTIFDQIVSKYVKLTK